MKRVHALPTLLAVLVGVLAGCGDNSRDQLAGPEEPSFQQDCSLWPDGCPGDPVPPPGPGYHIGSATTPALCFSPTGVNINDFDYDGMADGCEERLADLFRPAMTVAPSTYDCAPTIEPYWAAKYFPSSSNLVRIAYLLAYRRDCGNTGIGSGLLARLITVVTLNGALTPFPLDISTDDPGAGHSGDSEWVMVNIRYNYSTTRWYVVSVKFSAHDGTIASGTREWPMANIEIPVGSVSGGYPRVWTAANKHANYVNRAYCNAGRGPLGAAKDNCDSNIRDVYRLSFYRLRNVGSRQQNMLNCVQSSEPIFYPGTECFWQRTNNFDGWLQYPYGHPASPYYGSLVMHFECLSFTPATGSIRTCSSFGVNRLGT